MIGMAMLTVVRGHSLGRVDLHNEFDAAIFCLRVHAFAFSRIGNNEMFTLIDYEMIVGRDQ